MNASMTLHLSLLLSQIINDEKIIQCIGKAHHYREGGVSWLGWWQWGSSVRNRPHPGGWALELCSVGKKLGFSAQVLVHAGHSAPCLLVWACPWQHAPGVSLEPRWGVH